MNRIFIGYDHRQPVSYNVLHNSIMRTATSPVSITPLVIDQLPIKRMGLTPFTYTRFLVPWLCNYEGSALFLDLDMLCRADITELFEMYDERYAVQVVKHERQFERASLMLFNNDKNRMLTPHAIESASALHGIQWLPPQLVGDLPHEWNHLVGYDQPRDDAKLVHFTMGVPAFEETKNSEYAGEWMDMAYSMASTVPWKELMGPSVHTNKDQDHLMPRLGAYNET